MLSNISIKLLSIFLMPLYTRVLSPDAYGITDTILELAALVVGAFSLCIDWGVSAFFYDQKDEGYYKTITSSGTLFCIVSAVACLLVGFLSRPISQWLFKTPSYWFAVFLGFGYSAIKLVFFAFRVSTRMRGKMKEVAVYSVVELLVMLICNILFILVFKMGYMSIMYANVISMASSCVMYTLGNKGYFSFSSVDKPLLKRLLVYSIPLTPTVLLTWINSFIDRFFIGQMHDQTAVGLYGTAFRIVTLVAVLTSSFLSAYPSFAYSNADDPEMRPKYASVYDGLVMCLGFLAVCGTTFAKEIMIIITDKAYHECFTAVGVLFFSHVFYTLGNTMGYGITIAKKGKLYLLVNLSGAVCNIGLNFLLVPKLGYLGASITTCASQFIMMLLSYLVAEKLFPCRYRLIRSILTLFICLGGSYAASLFLPFLLKILVAIALIGVIVLMYIDQLKAIKNEMIGLLKKKKA